MLREVDHLVRVTVLLFALLFGGVLFWNLVEGANLARREDNPRRVLAELNIERGTIYDRNGMRLAYSRPTSGRLGKARVYPDPAVVGLVGHYSYQYGQAGIEEGYDRLLRGAHLSDAWMDFENALLHRATSGADLRITLDLAVQEALFAALEGQSGAGVVAAVPSGEVLAMVSQPAYDPNQVDADWNALQAEAEASPLLNRALNGSYQPGGALQTLLLSEMLARGAQLADQGSVATFQLVQPPLELTCALPPAGAGFLNLGQAYLAGCPAPFVMSIGESISATAMQEKLRAAGLTAPPEITGIPLPSEAQISLPPMTEQSSTRLLAEAAGQGQLLVSPAQMVQIAAALINQGRGVPLHVGLAYRNPGAMLGCHPPADRSPGLMQSSQAETLRTLLEGHSLAPDVALYGHLSQAFAGDRAYTWFVGWAQSANGATAALAVILAGVEPAQLIERLVPVAEAFSTGQP
ncbi:MAG: hypothetical protein HC915_00020 [Anaerolineae bacterium]|nr:hypothetical protein [Anaerolineae bacterium]